MMGAIIQKGIKYGSGNDGFSPIVTVTDIENGHKVDVRDINGVKSFEVLNGADGIDAPCDGLMFTSLEELGLTAPATVGEVFMAMPERSRLMLNAESYEEKDENSPTITDVPTEFGVLTIDKWNNFRFRIEFNNSLGGSAANVKQWIGALKGSDGTGLYWKELSAEPTFVNFKDIGLTANATLQDVIDALPKGGSALLGVKEFTNYQTIFPYEEGNDQFARVYIAKGVEDGSCVYARWFRKDGTKEAIASFNINDNKFNGWQRMIGENSWTDPYSCAGYKRLTGTEDLFTLGTGHYVSEKANTAYNYPITDSDKTNAHIYVLGYLNDKENNKGYRIILYFDNKGRAYNVNEWWGVFGSWNRLDNDTRVTTLETQVSELFQSVSNGKKLVANAITGKGVSTSTSATFATMATNISKIPQTTTYKEETVSATPDANSGIARFVFSNTVLGVRQMTAPGYHYSAETTENKMFTINGKTVEVKLDSGTWKMTAMVRSS